VGGTMGLLGRNEELFKNYDCGKIARAEITLSHKDTGTDHST